MPDQDVSTRKSDEQAHTPEPWFTETGNFNADIEATYIIGNKGWAYSGDQNQRTLAILGHWKDRLNAPEDAARIVACINACTGLSDEQMALLPELVAACNELCKAGGGSAGIKALAATLKSRLKAFEAMWKAVQRSVEWCDAVPLDGTPGDLDSFNAFQLRAALKLAEECEATP